MFSEFRFELQNIIGSFQRYHHVVRRYSKNGVLFVGSPKKHGVVNA